MMKSLASTSLPLAAAALAALLSAGCGRRSPHTAYSCEYGSLANDPAYRAVPVTYSPEGGYYVATVPESAQTVYIVVDGAPPQEAQPVAAPQPIAIAAPQVEAPPENPFATTRSWTGKYVCSQGITELTFRVAAVRGSRVDAVFHFLHEDSGAAGSYHMSGRFNPRSRSVSFEPGDWIERPARYVPVTMEGRVSSDGSRFEGRIPHQGCSWFRLSASK